MVLAIDGRGLGGAPRGVARYARGLLDALAATHPEVEQRLLPAGGRAATLRTVLTGRPPIEELVGGADVLWLPAPRPAAVGPRTGLVLTVHDRSWEDRPSDFTRYERLFHRATRPHALARRADRVLFDSAAVRDDVVPAWGLDPARARLAPPGVSAPGPTPPLPAGIPERFLLWVGALEPRKGPDVLQTAFTQARREGLAAALVVVGAGREAGALHGPGVHHLGRADDDVLAALLPRALALVAPSFGEGYGLGPLEAAAHGTPSIVSDLPVFRETLAGGALFTPVGDAGALAAALLRLEREPGLRARLIAAAPPRPTWEAAAEVLYAAVRAAAEARA